MNIAIGADHAGFSLKQHLVRVLQAAGHTVTDLGTHSEDAVDYPDFAKLVVEALAQGTAERGVLACGSGIGMCISANRTAGVRAAVLRSPDDARLSREHNDANVACFGGRLTGPTTAESLLTVWLQTPFAGGRHERRVHKLG
ncbi:MAG: ribose 5-phosphate isomerase B [Deltaproteobacteria bacterium]|nr:ribose 5-phosphate isomerase B [Deltaproteobacteria bacterium]